MRVKMLESREAAPDGMKVVQLEAGQVVELPDRLAERYLNRGLAKKAGGASSEASPAPRPPDDAQDPDKGGGAGEGEPGPAASLEKLVALKRGDLDAMAAAGGVENADKLPNKQAVAEAILAAQA